MRIDMAHMTKAKKPIARRITRRGHPQTDAERDTGPFTEPLAQACCIRRGQRGRRNRATAMRRIVHVEPQITSR